MKKYIVGKLSKKRIQAFTLNRILSESKYKKRQIDLLDIDVEGAELNVLKGLSFKLYKPKLICIEIWQDQIEEFNIKKNEIYKFLFKKKYKLITNLADNFIFKKI